MESKVLLILEELHAADQATSPVIRAALYEAALRMAIDLGKDAQKELDALVAKKAPPQETF